MSPQMTDVQTYPPAIELFRTPARRALVRFALDADDEWYTKQDLADAIPQSRESVRKQFREQFGITLVEMGIFDIRDDDANIPHYRVADSTVMDLLRQYDTTEGTYPLDELFDYTATQDLVLFFLEGADPKASYSRNGLTEEADVHYTSVMNHIETLVDAGIVEAVEGTRGTEYRRAQSEATEFLFALNQALVEYIEGE